MNISLIVFLDPVCNQQEALAEKTQHVDQLMRERDVERAEVARMAAQADEATRAAHEMRLQLDQVWRFRGYHSIQPVARAPY